MPSRLAPRKDRRQTHAVTVRDRDSMAQDTIPAENVRRYLEDRIDAWTPAA